MTIKLTSASAGTTREDLEKAMKGRGVTVEEFREVSPYGNQPVEPETPEAKTTREAKETEDKARAGETAESKQEREEEERAASLTGETVDEQKAREAEENDDETKADPAKKLSRSQKIAARVTKRFENQIADLTKRLEAAERGGNRPGTETAAPTALKAPDRKDFKTDAEFNEAVEDHKFEVRLAKRQAKEAQEAETTQLQENWNGYKSQVVAAKEKYDDWEETVGQDIPMSTAEQIAVIECENGADISYYLGKHPQYAKEISQLSPTATIMEIGRLSEQLKGSTNRGGSAADRRPTNKPRTVVPAPIRHVRTSSTTAQSGTAAATTMAEFRAARNRGRERASGRAN